MLDVNLWMSQSIGGYKIYGYMGGSKKEKDEEEAWIACVPENKLSVMA